MPMRFHIFGALSELSPKLDLVHSLSVQFVKDCYYYERRHQVVVSVKCEAKRGHAQSGITIYITVPVRWPRTGYFEGFCIDNDV
jgi:hypothetical protein